ncbi:MAG: sigma-70 family RNA polymerase sigma factor [bacterium]
MILATLLRWLRGEGDEHPDRALVRTALAGDADAQRHLVDRLAPVFWAALRRSLGPGAGEAVLWDAYQRIWATAWERDGRLLRAFDPARASLEHYAAHILARHVIGHQARAHARQKRGGGAVHVPMEAAATTVAAPEESRLEEAQLAQRIVEQVMAVLPARGQLVLQLIYGDGRTPAEAADDLGVSRQVIDNWTFRIRTEARRVRDALDAEGDGLAMKAQ